MFDNMKKQEMETRVWGEREGYSCDKEKNDSERGFCQVIIWPHKMKKKTPHLCVCVPSFPSNREKTNDSSTVCIQVEKRVIKPTISTSLQSHRLRESDLCFELNVNTGIYVWPSQV